MRSQVGFPKNFVANFVANFVEGWPPLAYWASTKFATKFATLCGVENYVELSGEKPERRAFSSLQLHIIIEACKRETLGAFGL
jgi:hypothetical protein